MEKEIKTEDVVLEETTGNLSRHPHVDCDDVDDFNDAAEENEDDNNGEYEEEECSEEPEEMTRSEACNYVEKEIDNKFMDDVTVEKMSPEKAAIRIKELTETNEKYQERVEELEPIKNISDLDVLRDLVKEQTHNAIDDIEGADAKEGAKTAKDGIKGLESIAYVESLINIALREYHNKTQAIRDNNKKIEEIKNSGYQASLFQGEMSCRLNSCSV